MTCHLPTRSRTSQMLSSNSEAAAARSSIAQHHGRFTQLQQQQRQQHQGLAARGNGGKKDSSKTILYSLFTLHVRTDSAGPCPSRRERLLRSGYAQNVTQAPVQSGEKGPLATRRKQLN